MGCGYRSIDEWMHQFGNSSTTEFGQKKKNNNVPQQKKRISHLCALLSNVFGVVSKGGEMTI